MELFFELEVLYIIIAIFILSLTAFVTTRDSISKVIFNRSMLGISAFLIFMITFHYNITVNKMRHIKDIFNQGERIICENKIHRISSQSLILSKKLGWSIDGDRFINDKYDRDFHTSECKEYIEENK